MITSLVRRRIVFGLVATLALAALPPHAFADGGEHDHDAARHAVQRGEALPLSKVIAAIGSKLPGEIVEIEFESEHGRWVYEFRVIDKTGRLHEIYVDAATARILSDRED